MNNYHVMTASFEARKNSQAALITAGFAGLMILIMFLLRWELPVIEPQTTDPGIEVTLNFEDFPTPVAGGGGGGGNPVQASGPAGAAPYTPPQPGVNEESDDVTTFDNEKATTTINKPVTTKPVNKVVENASVVKAKPKPVETPPAPQLKKGAQMGKTTGGSGKGGDVADNYDKTGGTGNGAGVGNGSGYGGGTGGGNGGGNGTGSGTGNGPKRISGNRVVLSPKNMDAGENLRGKVLAEIKVSPDGVGTFVRTTRGSTYTSGQAIDIIKEWLRRNRFNTASEESLVVYEFNFLMGG